MERVDRPPSLSGLQSSLWGQPALSDSDHHGRRADRRGGGMQFSSPAWRVEARDQWIGWTDTVRKKRLQRIVSNSRFLILPSVQVKGLASHVLSLVSRQLAEEWYASYRVRPVLLETFVEQERYRGTCYRAANWICLGQTRGRGRMDRDHREGEPIKTVWVYPLDKRFRQILNGERSA